MPTHALPIAHAYDVPGFTPAQVIEYKQTVNSSGGAVSLDLHVFTPDDHRASDRRPTIVFFFGGGWNSGSPSQFHPHCEYLAARGMVAISADYRVKNVHGTTPQECVQDGKSAVRWIRENATTLGVDPDMIAAGGGSSGGHVAAAAGTLSGFEEAGENLAISSKPNALVLFNPVIDNGPGGYGHNTVQAYWEAISPLHNIDASAPPTVFFLGTNDALIPVATAERYKSAMEAEGLRCDLHLYQGQPHSFFNYDVPDDGKGPYDGYLATVFRMDEFLVSLGYLGNPHIIPDPVVNWVTIFGDAGFSGGSEGTASPVTTDGNADAIAANIAPVRLRDGEFIRLTGSVLFDAPLSGGNFRIGLFDGDDRVTPGDGTGYAGIWAEAPATAAANIAAGDGTGTSHPFESLTATVLGAVPATAATVPANTPVAFTLVIARNGGDLDISATFTDHGSYHQSQNLLNKAVEDHSYNSAAFLMNGDLNATQGSFSNIEIASGPTLPVPDSDSPPSDPTSRVITYVEAVAGAAGNTFATGGSLADISWLLDPGSSSANQTQWGLREFGNNNTLFQALHSLPDTMPELTTRLTGLAAGTYDVWAFYWDQVASGTQNWILSAGLTSGALASYSSPGEPDVAGTIKTNVVNAANLRFTTSVLVVDGGGLRNLFGVHLGQATVSGGAAIDVHVDNLIGNGSSNRAWFDGVGFAHVYDFDSWISGFSVDDQTGFTDDPDGDGNANGLENYLGTDPSVADAAEPGLVVVDPDGGNSLTFTHPRGASPAEDVSATYEWSTGLDTFFDDGISNGAGTSVAFVVLPDSPTPGTTTVTATVTGTVMPERLFARLRVTQITP